MPTGSSTSAPREVKTAEDLWPRVPPSKWLETRSRTLARRWHNTSAGMRKRVFRRRDRVEYEQFFFAISATFLRDLRDESFGHSLHYLFFSCKFETSIQCLLSKIRGLNRVLHRSRDRLRLPYLHLLRAPSGAVGMCSKSPCSRWLPSSSSCC